MYEHTTTIEINGKKYNESNIRILLGLEEVQNLKQYLKKNRVSEDILKIAYVIDRPTRLTTMLKEIYHIPHEDNEDVRLALARVQIDAALRMNENLQRYMQLQFVSETIERLIFGELLLDGKTKKESEKGKKKAKPVGAGSKKE